MEKTNCKWDAAVFWLSLQRLKKNHDCEIMFSIGGWFGPVAFVMYSVNGDTESHRFRVKLASCTLLSIHLYTVDLEDLKMSLCCSSLNRGNQSGVFMRAVNGSPNPVCMIARLQMHFCLHRCRFGTAHRFWMAESAEWKMLVSTPSGYTLRVLIYCATWMGAAKQLSSVLQN